MFYSLEDITHASPQQVGESARLLSQLRQAGHRVQNSWIITNDAFQQVRQTLTNREPALADWPHLLWQAPASMGYQGQQLAKRLRQPLLNLPLNWPFEDLLETLATPVVRLLPSLWLGGLPTGAWAQMLGAPVCWADPAIVETTLKQLWAEIFSARSLAYWRHWPGHDPDARSYPPVASVAVILQAVEPLQLSGTFTIRRNGGQIQAVRGLPDAISDSIPDSFDFQGQASSTPASWQPGYQEWAYQPAERSAATIQTEPCLSPSQITQTARESLPAGVEQQLLQLALQLQAWATAPVKVGWAIANLGEPVRLTGLFQWPLVPVGQNPASPSDQLLTGQPASPGKVTGQTLVIRPGDRLPATADRHILIASEVYPHWISLLKTATAIVSETGGLTCHAAILARELQLPAIVGVAQATQRLQSGDAIEIDGDLGVIRPASLDDRSQNQATGGHRAEPLPMPELTGETALWLNLSQPESAATLATLPLAGIGLLRSEWLMMSTLDQQHPYRWIELGRQAVLKARLVAQLRPILQAFAHRPVRYRSLDIRSHEFARLAGAPPVEANPMLGVRGTFSYQQQPDFFRLELAVLRQLQVEGHHNLQLLLPFVRTVEEVRYCQQLIQASGLQEDPAFQLWIMAEVPSVLFLLADYVAAGVQGVAIGTNDLTQLLFGVDRDQALFSAHFNECHPAAKAAIAQLIQQARTLGIPCTLCGVAPAHHPGFVAFLVEQGITGISVDAAAVEPTAVAIQQAEARQQQSSA